MTQPPPLIDCVIEDPRWHAAGLPDWAEESARATLLARDLPPAGFEISLLGCDDVRIAGLNAAFRDQNKPTNVLSWPSAPRGPSGPGETPAPPVPGHGAERTELGDIALAYDTCADQALAAGLSLQHHAQHLIVHGVLHLLGYDHQTEADALLMERLEVGILRKMGISDPYLAGTTAEIGERAD